MSDKPRREVFRPGNNTLRVHSSKIDRATRGLEWVGTRLKEEIKSQGLSARRIAPLLVERTPGWKIPTARTWLGLLHYDLKRILFREYAAEHKYRLAVLMELLKIPSDDLIVQTLRKEIPDFRYPQALKRTEPER